MQFIAMLLAIVGAIGGLIVAFIPQPPEPLEITSVERTLDLVEEYGGLRDDRLKHVQCRFVEWQDEWQVGVFDQRGDGYGLMASFPPDATNEQLATALVAMSDNFTGRPPDTEEKLRRAIGFALECGYTIRVPVEVYEGTREFDRMRVRAFHDRWLPPGVPVELCQ